MRAETLLLLESPDLRPGLCSALRIQLTDVAEVECQAEGKGAPLSVRIARAATAATSWHARLAVLLERDPDPRLVRMYLVGARAERAVIAIERIEDRDDADVDRSLALEVRSALEALSDASVASATHRPEPLAPVLAPRLRRAAEPSWLALLEAGGAWVVGTHRHGAATAGLGVRRVRGPMYAELLLTGRVESRELMRSRAGAVRLRAWGAALEARVGRTLRWAALGGVLALGVDRVAAAGTTRDGTTGSATLGLPRIALGLDLRLFLMRGATLRLSPMLEVLPIMQRYALDEQVVGTLGRARLALPLTLLVSLPFRAREAADAR